MGEIVHYGRPFRPMYFYQSSFGTVNGGLRCPYDPPVRKPIVCVHPDRAAPHPHSSDISQATPLAFRCESPAVGMQA
ncbi:MAG: hypothetical protein ABSD89_15625 [Halobacteriota archaeon]